MIQYKCGCVADEPETVQECAVHCEGIAKEKAEKKAPAKAETAASKVAASKKK